MTFKPVRFYRTSSICKNKNSGSKFKRFSGCGVHKRILPFRLFLLLGEHNPAIASPDLHNSGQITTFASNGRD